MTNFSVWSLVTLVVGNAIGAGIYTTSGFALADLGTKEWVMLAWFVAGLIALMGAISYGMLVQEITESGGEYLYLHRRVHPLAGFIAGWISLLAGFPGAIAFAASALEAYASEALPALALWPDDALAVITILFAGIIHSTRIRSGARIHEWIVAFMLFAIVIVVALAGLELLGRKDLPVASAQPDSTFNLLAFAGALVWISLSYSGFNAAAYIAGEVSGAKSRVPKGMLWGTLLTMVLCLLVNGVILYGVPDHTLAGRPDIATIAANAYGGSTAKRVVELLIALSLLTSITAMVLAGPRVTVKMAEDGALPRLFKMKEDKPPRAAITLQVITALALVLIADLRDLLSYLGLTLSLCLALAVSSLFVTHWRQQRRPKSAWYPFAPIVFVLCTVIFACLSALNEPRQLALAGPTLIAGAVAYLLQTRVFGRV